MTALPPTPAPFARGLARTPAFARGALALCALALRTLVFGTFTALALRTLVLGTFTVLALAAALAPEARAEGLRGLPAGTPADYVSECASCHVAYPPALLPAASWARLMARLDAHYGSDASLDAATLARIARWLQAEAGTGRRASVAPPEDRITPAPWFERTHRKVDAAVWTLPSVKRAANCGACHGGAARGVYDDDDLTVPAGTTPSRRRAFSD